MKKISQSKQLTSAVKRATLCAAATAMLTSTGIASADHGHEHALLHDVEIKVHGYVKTDATYDLNMTPEISAKKTLPEVEQEMIESALKDCAWKIECDSGAATRLAMAPSTLRERIKKYGLERYGSDAETATEPVQIE